MAEFFLHNIFSGATVEVLYFIVCKGLSDKDGHISLKEG